MKKLITSCAIVLAAVAIVGCDQKKDGAAPAAGSSASAAASDIPTFSSAKVNEYIKAYTEYCKEYAANAKNPAKLVELSKKGQELGEKAQAAAAEIKPDEMQKYSDYVTKLAQEMAAAAQ